MNIDSSTTVTTPRDFEALPQFFVEPLPGNVPSASGAFHVTQEQRNVRADWSADIIYDNRLSKVITHDMVDYALADVQRFPANAKALVNLALAFAASGKLQEAQQTFIDALKADSHNYVALTNLVKIDIQLGNHSEAEALCRKGLSIYRKDSAFLISLSAIEMNRKNPKGALALLQDAFSAEQKDPAIQYALGVIYLALGEFRKALTFIKRASKTMERSPQIQQALGVAYALSGQSKEATRAFQTAIALDKNAAASIKGLAQVFYSTGQHERVVQLLSSYMELKDQDGDEAQDLLAQSLFKTEKSSQSREILQQILDRELKQNPDNAYRISQLLNDIACCYSREGNLGKAEDLFRSAIAKCETRGPLAFLNLASQLGRQKESLEAKSLLRRAIGLFPQESLLHLELANLEEKDGNYDYAISSLKTAMKLGDAPAVAYTFLGWLLSDWFGDLDEATSVLEVGIRKFPKEIGIANNLAYVYLLMNKLDKADALLQRAQSFGPNIFVTATMGLLELKRGSLQKAKALYERSVELANARRDNLNAQAVRQKMHLEFAKYFFTKSDLDAALAEARAGMAVKNGRRSYERDLRRLEEALV